MLIHTAIGPYGDGTFLVAYETPGCTVPTPVCVCKTETQAQEEADRLNRDQLVREEVLRMERRLRGLEGIYPALEGAK